MNDLESLKLTLEMAKKFLDILEVKAAGYSVLTIPADLQLQLNEKRKEVDSLETRIGLLKGLGSKDLLYNLPRSEDFVGRSKEINQCLEALDPQVRGWGVVIDGIGGVGKTALAVEVAHKAHAKALFDAYLYVSAKTTWLSPDGVRQRTLSRSSLDAFCREFANLLNEAEIAQMSNVEQRHQALLAALTGRRTLLIWDNLETLIAEERYLIADFLSRLPAPNKAIVTSRYRTGESAITIRLNSLSEQEAKLIIKAQSKFTLRLNNELISSDESVYRALYDASGGNPLALKWTLGLVAQKGYTLQGALKCLRDAAQSDDLYSFLFTDVVRDLVKADKDILVTLATFNNPATAESLTDSTGLDATETSVALGRLVTLSLVNDIEGDIFGLHPLTRNFVNTVLKAEPKHHDEPSTVDLPQIELEPDSQRKALRYWIDYAQKYGDGQEEAYKNFDKLEHKWSDLEGAATTLSELFVPSTVQKTDKEAGRMLIDLASALSTFLWFRGYWDERIQLNKLAYNAAQVLGDWEAASWCAADVAWIYYYRAETTWAEDWVQRMTKAVIRGGTHLSEAASIRRHGALAQQRGDLDEAERLYNEALALFRNLEKSKKIENEAIVLNDLGGLAHQRREYDIAKEYYNQALIIAQKAGDKAGQAMYIGNLSNVALSCSELGTARSLYEKELALAKEVGRKDLIADAQYGLARILEKEERPDEALIYARDALTMRSPTRERQLKRTQKLVDRLQQVAIDSSQIPEPRSSGWGLMFFLISFSFFILCASFFILGYTDSGSNPICVFINTWC